MREKTASAAPHELGTRSVTVLGRSADCDVVVSDPGVSRRHATIELVMDQHLLRDEGSSNGTFLNGLRIAPGKAFSLREGDVIELGNERLVYGPGARLVAVPPPVVQGAASASFPTADLVRDGRTTFTLDELAELDRELAAAFAGAGRIIGLERALSCVERRIDADAGAVFASDSWRVRALAAKPVPGVAVALAALVDRASSSLEGQLEHARPPQEVVVWAETAVPSPRSAIAAPMIHGNDLVGVLALSRDGKKLFDRADLARLAVVGERIALAILAREGGEKTPHGYGGPITTRR
ncbi:MAG TPA: FHA domain-containing protein [Planctomycetota bacterium]|nr:FHA domain-containing protein [Planctomycetota bacterium]